jgi:hypothetical protein
MNDYDRNNLEFISSLNEQEFDTWMETLDDDDVHYAIDLLQQARVELLGMEQDLLEPTLFPEAMAIIKQIKSKL